MREPVYKEGKATAIYVLYQYIAWRGALSRFLPSFGERAPFLYFFGGLAMTRRRTTTRA
jgi:hypothetical protein